MILIFILNKRIKKLKKNKNIKNYSNGEKMNMPELKDIFKKQLFKKTIIIDNEGNNNLELLIDQGNNDTNIKNNNKEKEIEPITESKEKEDNVNTETTNLFTTSYEN